jgi:hypothetical protein
MDKQKEMRLIFGTALLAISVLCVGQLLSVSALDAHLESAIHFFALSIPCLCASYLIEKHDFTIPNWPTAIVFLAGAFTTLFGLWSVFKHFSESAGNTFGVTAVIAAIGTMWAIIQHERKKQ